MPPCLSKGRCNIPPFPKSCHWGRHKHVTWCEARSWAVNSDNKFVFKIKALHCTPLEFRIGFLVGGFNLKVPTVPSLPLQQQGDTTKQLQRPRRHYHLPDLSSCPVAHLNVSEWSDGLTAVISCFLVLKLPAVGRNCWHIDGSDLHSSGGGNKCTLRGIRLDQNRPPIYRLLSKSVDLVAKRTAGLAAYRPV